MTKTFDQDNGGASRRQPIRPEPNKIVRGLFTTLPIVLVGSIAMSLNATGPIHTTDLRRDKPRATPAELGKSIRDAFTAAARATTSPEVSSVSHGTVTAAVAAAPATYRVVAGDTVSGIAGRYGLATASVLALNGLSWKSVIFAGQTLKLGTSGVVATAAPAIAAPTGRYTIQKGDSIGGIAAKFGLATQTLLSANGLAWTSIIYPGQTIAIPGSTGVASAAPASQVRVVEAPSAPAAARTPVTYTIASGDSITKIAAKFGVTVQAILTANNLTWSSIIYGGRTLTIPSAPTVVPASSNSSAVVPASPSVVVALTSEMATNARTIVTVGRSLGVPEYGLVVALAAAAQESGLRNLNYGDRDSIGIFQQRPSTGWGTPEKILDPTYSARLFFGGPKNPNAAFTRGLLDIPGWQTKSVTDAAQAVQLSGYPAAYAKWETSARSWLATIR
ncbi:LysM peptidoglycan-binding domain-containing protein [Frigoribacterium sp. CG_9.8]|uniref:muramidase family protein n=1 Tax=Frigoribacterium sp. CG_9.8 TaxID=2787733 RepID=UPI0018CAC3DD|nr:LysM peptidoglycan-binding domain-containing protein [Frigoribacterium sp. CG_9.8]MBG6107857.1 LysM repeat protein [Frigoribacterium sp. CG_9.8]